MRSRARVDPEPATVDHDMVVIPTHGGEVVGIIGAFDRPLLNVVRLKSRGGCAPVSGTQPAIPSEDPSSGSRWDARLCGAMGKRGPGFAAAGHLDHGVAEDAFQCVGTYSGARYDPSPGLSVGSAGISRIDNHRGDCGCRALSCSGLA